MTGLKFRRTYQIGTRTAEFTCPNPRCGGIVNGAVIWRPTVPRGIDLSAADWLAYARARDAFHREVEEEFGVIVTSGEAAGIN